MATAAPRHHIERLRREPKRRRLTVTSVTRVTPRMARITFTSPDLVDFDSAAADDHIKIFLPTADGTVVMRDYTPRAFDPAAASLILDFALHDSGPATDWAAKAAVGDVLEIGGPRGSVVVPDDFDWYLLIGDETALPAIGRRLEGLRAGVPVTTIVSVADRGEIQAIDTAAHWHQVWIARDAAGADETRSLLDALKAFKAPPGDGFVWIAAEAGAAKALKAHMLDTLRHPPGWLKASGYWVRGAAGAHEKLE
ncbi:siderophore-interacting protein [Rhizobiales bacterium Sp-1]|uniref:Siderophore-interacting protein n=2 Tax=Segnochrobactrum spirostomi TaxID=2608987 RepID=A0A6A7Y809_9HYPH|nr:siderophore-interacting protein [Segnochrobactrum spirostomi]